MQRVSQLVVGLNQLSGAVIKNFLIIGISVFFYLCLIADIIDLFKKCTTLALMQHPLSVVPLNILSMANLYTDSRTDMVSFVHIHIKCILFTTIGYHSTPSLCLGCFDHVMTISTITEHFILQF